MPMDRNIVLSMLFSPRTKSDLCVQADVPCPGPFFLRVVLSLPMDTTASARLIQDKRSYSYLLVLFLNLIPYLGTIWVQALYVALWIHMPQYAVLAGEESSSLENAIRFCCQQGVGFIS